MSSRERTFASVNSVRGEDATERLTLVVIINGVARVLIPARVWRTDTQGNSRRKDDRTSGPVILLSEQDEKIEPGNAVAPTDEQGFERSSGVDSCTSDDQGGDYGANSLDEGLSVPRSHGGCYHGGLAPS